MIANTPSIKVVITFKPSKHPHLFGPLLDIAGFEPKQHLIVHKTGLGGKSETNTVYFCTRTAPTPRHAAPLSSFDQPIDKVFLSPVWNGTKSQQRDLYDHIHKVAAKQMEPAKREGKAFMFGEERKKVQTNLYAKCLVEDILLLGNAHGRSWAGSVEFPSPEKKRSRGAKKGRRRR